MNAGNILGVIYSNGYDGCLPELTALRTMGSVPFGGRYRLIDFPLSNMVNCGITKVGVITKSNFQSLMDHLSHGKPWDLSRKTGGLFLLPPFDNQAMGAGENRLGALKSGLRFLSSFDAEYVIIADCNVVSTMDYGKLADCHIEKNADITLTYTKGVPPKLDNLITFDSEEDGRLKKAAISPQTDKKVNYSLNTFVMRKALLERLINEAASLNYTSFEHDIIQKNVRRLRIYGYPVPERSYVVDGLQAYYDISLSLLEKETRSCLFLPERPVLTKVRDDMPVIYGINCDIKNSLVADGCIIDGEVENSVLFRGVKVAKDAVVKNSVVMQGGFIGEGAVINCAIMDKDVTVKPRKTISGAEDYPIYVGKGIVI
ncbi:MAG: glucose-1-phosphate adenylyltransferase subunit GlgD [Oscillospiraceae bacterium]|nr:glucose-1-phosphate adenylyltransferase subunit GlgD [Oscillospiraceae bacterium]